MRSYILLLVLILISTGLSTPSVEIKAASPTHVAIPVNKGDFGVFTSQGFEYWWGHDSSSTGRYWQTESDSLIAKVTKDANIKLMRILCGNPCERYNATLFLKIQLGLKPKLIILSQNRSLKGDDKTQTSHPMCENKRSRDENENTKNPQPPSFPALTRHSRNARRKRTRRRVTLHTHYRPVGCS